MSEKNLTFTAGQKLTIISVSSGMACTIKREVLVSGVLPEPEPRYHYQNGPIDAYRVGSYRIRGKRKDFYLDIPLNALVFEGWDLPVIIDSEIPGYNGFHGNACLNLTLSTDGDELLDERERESTRLTFLRAFIDSLNLNPYFTDQDKAKIIIPGASVHEEGTLLYPELESGQAVIEQMKEKAVASS